MGNLLGWGSGPLALMAAMLAVAACGPAEPEGGRGAPGGPVSGTTEGADGTEGPAGAEDPGLARPDIVLVSIDTLRSDHLGAYGYFRDTSPRLDAFAASAILFEKARAPMATTLPSHASMLTGRYPLEHGILANVAHGGASFGGAGGPVSFAQVLEAEGYRTAAFVSSLPLDRSTGIAVGFEVFDQPEELERTADVTIGRALAWLEEVAEDRRSAADQRTAAADEHRPLFLFVHLFDPHWKHRPPEPFLSRYQTGAGLDAWIAEREIPDFASRSRQRKATNTRRSLNRYGGEIRFTDDQVGRLFDALREAGLYDTSIVTLVADHGDGLNQHDWVAHGMVWEEQLRVPWLLRFPGSDRWPARIASNVSLIDLFPTLLGRMRGLTSPLAQRFSQQATGVDVLAPGFEERPIFAQRTGREIPNDPGPVWALVDGDWKFILREQAGDVLFDLAADPHELVDVSASHPERAAAMRAALLGSMAEQRARGAALGADLQREAPDAERLLQLEQLGYLGAGSEDEDGQQD